MGSNPPIKSLIAVSRAFSRASKHMIVDLIPKVNECHLLVSLKEENGGFVKETLEKKIVKKTMDEVGEEADKR